jgi:hypothetical protein
MKLVSAVEMGLGCGLDTIDAVYSQLYRNFDIFPHDKFDHEIEELDMDRLANGVDMYDTLESIIDKLSLEKYYKDPEDELYGYYSLRRKICE